MALRGWISGLGRRYVVSMMAACSGLTCFLWASPLAALDQKMLKHAVTPAAFTLDAHHLIPSVLPVASPNGDQVHALVVDKSRQQLSVFVNNGELTERYRFVCSTGQITGPKEVEGDKKTPEGIYFINDHHLDDELSETYGTRAFTLDYPNLFDQQRQRTGHSIWIHGTNKKLKPRDSNGCIVLGNEDIDHLAPFIELERTPVVVVDRLEFLPPHEAFSQAEIIRQALSRYRRCLSRMDFAGYSQMWGGPEALRTRWWTQWLAFRRNQDPNRDARLHFANVNIFKSHQQVVVTLDWNLSNQTEPWRRARLYLTPAAQGYHIIDVVGLPRT